MVFQEFSKCVMNEGSDSFPEVLDDAELIISRWAIPVVYRISVINKSKSNTTRSGVVFYSTTCFGLSLLGHHQVVASLLRKLYNLYNTVCKTG
jgi:hypothetical protein